jgi:hypothetical protein
VGRAYLLLEARVPARERRRPEEQEGVVRELLGLRTPVAAHVLHGERVDAERLGHAVEFVGAGVGHPDPRGAGRVARVPEFLRRVPVDAVVVQHDRLDHDPTAQSVRPTITPEMVNARPG